MKKFLSIYKLLGIICLFSASSQIFAQDTVKLMGSDLVGEKISAVLAEKLKKQGLNVSVDLSGSKAATDALKKNEADIAILALVRENDMLENYQYVPYTHQIAVVLANTANAMEEISLPQLREFFGGFSEALSKEEASSTKTIQPMLTSLKESLAVELFKYKCLNGENPSPKVEIKESTLKLAELIKNSVNAIGIGSFDPKAQNVKALAISDRRSDGSVFSFKPTVENVQNKDYPLTLSFYLVFKTNRTQTLKPVINLLFDDEIMELLNKGGFVCPPKNFIKSYLLGLDSKK